MITTEIVRTLIGAIGQHVPYDSMIIIFGCNSDKDIRGMLTELQYGADKVIFTRSSSPKAVWPHDLAEMYSEICGKMCQSTLSLGEALRVAQSAISREDYRQFLPGWPGQTDVSAAG